MWNRLRLRRWRPVRRRDAGGPTFDALRAIPVLADATDDELRRIDGLVTRVDVSAGRTLATGPALARQWLIVARGEVEVLTTARERVVLRAGALLGSAPIGERAVRAQHVVAASDATIYVANPREFSELMTVAAFASAMASEAPRSTVADRPSSALAPAPRLHLAGDS